jgi:hypothetical protein
MFRSAECSLFNAEGFFCRLDVPHGGLGINKLEFLIKNCKKFEFLTAVKYLNFWSSRPWIRNWIRIRIYPKMLDPNPH